MRAVVGVTDHDWAAFLRSDPRIYEANFWVPSGRAMQMLKPGEPFLFKTKAPFNRLVGGGFFERFWELRVSEAWLAFGSGNGVGSEDELRAKIQRYRASNGRLFEDDPTIGCVVLRNLFFAAPDSELAQPPGWGRSIVQWKSYDLDADDGRYVRFAFESLQSNARVDLHWDRDLAGIELDAERFGRPILTLPRLGQGNFRLAILDAYADRCAITGSRIAPALEAAHIRPYARGGEHKISNGMALRSDIHILFDRGYLGVTPDYRLRVSPRLRDEFGNGVDLYAREEARTVINLPSQIDDRPAREHLEWHMDTVFLAA